MEADVASSELRFIPLLPLYPYRIRTREMRACLSLTVLLLRASAAAADASKRPILDLTSPVPATSLAPAVTSLANAPHDWDCSINAVRPLSRQRFDTY
jgi:hypothetical protein